MAFLLNYVRLIHLQTQNTHLRTLKKLISYYNKVLSVDCSPCFRKVGNSIYFLYFQQNFMFNI